MNDALFDKWVDETRAITARREALCRLQPRCPACNDEQVQLLSWFSDPALWRCRICKHKFRLG